MKSTTLRISVANEKGLWIQPHAFDFAANQLDVKTTIHIVVQPQVQECSSRLGVPGNNFVSSFFTQGSKTNPGVFSMQTI